MKQLLIAAFLLLTSTSVFAQEQLIGEDVVTYHRFNPCTNWKYVSDFDSGINGHLCSWSPISTVEVPDIHSLIKVMQKMIKTINTLEDRIVELETKLQVEN
ncbi:MAG: hypothetical protein ISR65_02540 [Bacteriovoracaceae bacterium]|nr:hypothetical protein [Bacteriovoracaceae bacterium]